MQLCACVVFLAQGSDKHLGHYRRLGHFEPPVPGMPLQQRLMAPPGVQPTILRRNFPSVILVLHERKKSKEAKFLPRRRQKQKSQSLGLEKASSTKAL